jgi:hypothetical protein
MRTHLKQPLCLRERLLGRDVAILHTGTTKFPSAKIGIDATCAAKNARFGVRPESGVRVRGLVRGPSAAANRAAVYLCRTSPAPSAAMMLVGSGGGRGGDDGWPVVVPRHAGAALRPAPDSPLRAARGPPSRLEKPCACWFSSLPRALGRSRAGSMAAEGAMAAYASSASATASLTWGDNSPQPKVLEAKARGPRRVFSAF